ncbi:MAG: DivIVA domain-containing protein [Deltaproteobacteria bacterium]|nr:DivIVA domain-containing protein [Deltaproteobacteria bacterium]
MKLTPLDIRQKQFKTGFRGLDPKDVEAFLDLVASEFEELAKENLFIKDEISRKALKIDEYRDREKTLQETMVAAQKVAEDMKEAAKKQAEIVVSEAELQAEKIVQGAHQRLVEIVSEISELKRQRTQFESQVRSVIESHQKLLETFSSPAKAEDNVAYFAKK